MGKQVTFREDKWARGNTGGRRDGFVTLAVLGEASSPAGRKEFCPKGGDLGHLHSSGRFCF